MDLKNLLGIAVGRKLVLASSSRDTHLSIEFCGRTEQVPPSLKPDAGIKNGLTHLNRFAHTTVTRSEWASQDLTKCPNELGTTAMRPFKVNSVTLFIVIGLLGVIVSVLILPDVDLPDTAFQRNVSLQALRALSHQMPHPSVAPGQHISFQFSGTSTLARQGHESHARCFNDLPIQHKALRC